MYQDESRNFMEKRTRKDIENLRAMYKDVDDPDMKNFLKSIV